MFNWKEALKTYPEPMREKSRVLKKHYQRLFDMPEVMQNICQDDGNNLPDLTMFGHTQKAVYQFF